MDLHEIEFKANLDLITEEYVNDCLAKYDMISLGKMLIDARESLGIDLSGEDLDRYNQVKEISELSEREKLKTILGGNELIAFLKKCLDLIENTNISDQK